MAYLRLNKLKRKLVLHTKSLINLEIVILGLVQGVGFRPYIYNLALKYNLNGYVKNINSSLYIFIQSDDREAIDSFISILKSNPPKNAKIKAIKTKIIEHEGIFKSFSIESSTSLDSSLLDSTLPLDLAICEDCLRELESKKDRRYNYAFINCINCGPRYSIIKSLPYDRDKTAMSEFSMCKECESEYNDIFDRRFHAQPNSCHKCGISLGLYDANNNMIVSKDAILEAKRLLARDKILAIKGVGGFNLVCNVKQHLIYKLRERKRRPSKPFAIMFRDISHIKQYFNLSKKEEEILSLKAAPILLLNKKNARVKFPLNLAPNINTIGVIIAYSPLHKLLLKHRKAPLVFTSANLSKEPLVISRDEAFLKLGGVFEYLLDYNRDIINPIDDSLVQILSDATPLILRHARGFAPLSLESNINLDSSVKLESRIILALGANQKSQIALFCNNNIVISPYIGDLESVESVKRFREVIELFLSIFTLKPNVILCDMHPNYASTKIARELSKELNIELFGIYHHKAHFYSTMLDNNLANNSYLGVVFDGTGLGSDNNIWGGEIFLYKKDCTKNIESSLNRILHFKYIPLLGGEAAIKNIERIFVGVAFSTYHKEALDMLEGSGIANLDMLFSMFDKGINCPLSSSVGRLFDCVAYMCGLKTQSYEGESGMYLEALYREDIEQTYSYSVGGGEIVINWEEIFSDFRGHSKEHSSLGNHFIDLLDFRGLTDSSLVNPLKSSKNSKSTTANIRMLGGDNAMESRLDSALDSSDSIDSTQSVESNKINPHEAKRSATLKSVVGGGGESKNNDCGSELRFCLQLQSETQQNLSPLPLSQEFDRIGDSKAIKDSKGLEDSNQDTTSLVFRDSRLDFALDSKDSSIKSNLDLKASTTSKVSTNSLESTLLDSNTQIPLNNLIATKFINTLATIIADIATSYNLPVVFSGGVFQNKILCDKIISLFKSNNLSYHFPKQVSTNDGGISLGQIGAYLHNDCTKL